jgi:hypothetical protein
MTVTNQNFIPEEIKSRINLVLLGTIQFRTFCLHVYHPKKVKIKIYLLTYGAEPFLRSFQLCSHSGMGETRMHIGYWWESWKEKDHLEDQDIGVWTILKQILERYDGMI